MFANVDDDDDENYPKHTNNNNVINMTFKSKYTKFGGKRSTFSSMCTQETNINIRKPGGQRRQTMLNV